MKIAVFGLGYVGMTAAACLASEGHKVIGVDINDEKIAAINTGNAPIKEPGIDELVRKAVEKGLLLATKDASTYMNSVRMAFVCVGTPSAPDGSHNMGYVAEVSRQIALLIGPDRTEPLTVVFRSTMRPGTTDDLIQPIFEQVLKQNIGLVELVYNPEFLRESVAVTDFFNPPKIVIGTQDRKPCWALNKINEKLEAPVFYTNYREAELTKFVDNTFHAVKIVFANEIGRLCSQLGISARVAHEIFVSDTKLNISPYYLRPGGAFGGSCLPKDVRALQQISGDVGAHTMLVDSLMRSNEAHKHYLFELCTKGLAPHSRVLMLGLAFKADTDDLRESPYIDLARKILAANHKLSIYDPNVKPSKLLGQNLGYAHSNLPTLQKLLVPKSVIEAEEFDIVIDTKGWSKECSLHSNRIIDINALK